VRRGRGGEWVRCDAKLALPDCLEVDHRGKIADVGIEILMGMYGGGASSAFKRYSQHSAEVVGNEGVGLPFYPPGDVSVRRSAMGRIILEAAESRRAPGQWAGETVLD